MTFFGKKARLILRSLARRMLFPAIETCWTTLFHVARFVLRPSPIQVTFSGNDRVLVIAPHPDDETLGCGGTIVSHAEAGDLVQVFVVTDGGGSRANGLSRPTMVKLRALEALRAVSLLHPDAQLTLGHLPEGAWDTRALYSLLSAQLHRLRPTIIYAPSRVDFHPEHLKVARCLAQVLAKVETGTDARVRVYELQVPLSVPLVNRRVNIQSGLIRKRAALAEYRTQRESFAWRGRQERYLKALLGSGAATEVFCEMTTSGYVRLMTSTPNSVGHYRSLRPRPFTDGFAWVQGMMVRRRLLAIIEDRPGDH